MNWQLLFSFRGRINRAPYWLVTLAYLAILFAVLGLAYATASIIALVIGGILFVLFIVSALAVMVKRLHDRNKSAWWVLLFYVLPMLLSGMRKPLIAMQEPVALSLAFAGAVIGTVISIWALVELGFLRGTIGPNRYGPDPLG